VSTTATPVSTVPAILADSKARDALRGFLLTGMLSGILGSLIVAWRYQLDKDPRVVGLHFLAFNGLILLSGVVTQLLVRVSMEYILSK